MSDSKFEIGQAVVFVKQLDSYPVILQGTLGIVISSAIEGFHTKVAIEGQSPIWLKEYELEYLAPVTLAVKPEKRFEIPRRLYEKHELGDRYDNAVQQIEHGSGSPETDSKFPAARPTTITVGEYVKQGYAVKVERRECSVYWDHFYVENAGRVGSSYFVDYAFQTRAIVSEYTSLKVRWHDTDTPSPVASSEAAAETAIHHTGDESVDNEINDWWACQQAEDYRKQHGLSEPDNQPPADVRQEAIRKFNERTAAIAADKLPVSDESLRSMFKKWDWRDDLLPLQNIASGRYPWEMFAKEGQGIEDTTMEMVLRIDQHVKRLEAERNALMKLVRGVADAVEIYTVGSPNGQYFEYQSGNAFVGGSLEREYIDPLREALRQIALYKIAQEASE